MSRYLDHLFQTVMHRRKFIAATTGLAAAGGVAWLRQKSSPLFMPDLFPEAWIGIPNQIPTASPVAVLKTASYEEDLIAVIKEGIRLCDLEVKDKSVLLKPNLVEHAPDRPINTDPRVVRAAIEAFRSLGAASVTVGEGAGHRRDTELLLEATGLADHLRESKTLFVDLNLDDITLRKTRTSFTQLPEFALSNTLLRSDLVVSMPKLKTHHWVGATLSLKNLFGCIPGVVYGWPKNVLHWSGINESIVDIAALIRPGFAIVDGIVGMEGNGPINGSAKPFGALIFGKDLVAVDATCCRLIKIDPTLLPYLVGGGHFLGQGRESRINQRGESILSLAQPFALPPKLDFLRMTSSGLG